MHAAATWNARYADKEAFTNQTNRYRRGSIDDVIYGAHRVIWKWMTGEEPEEIDHINGMPFDNRFTNLRAVTHADNARNLRRPANNVSGITGVLFVAKSGRWRAQIRADNKTTHIGCFATAEEAAVARQAAERRLGFHPNHGLSSDQRGRRAETLHSLLPAR